MPENKDDPDFIESEGKAMEECLLLGSMFDREEDKEA
jgi:hypothetical protein